MEASLISIPFIVTLLILLILCKVPIAVALGTAGILGMWHLFGWEGMFGALKMLPYSNVASWSLMPVPLFILMGYFAAAGGVTDDAYRVAYKWVGRLPGGLAQASMLACGMFAAVSGSSVATAGTIGRIAIPEMLKYNYDKRLATGVVCCGGLLGVMIPPSMIFVIYGTVTQVSIGKLLIAGILPGILTIMAYALCIVILVKRRPNIAPGGESFNWVDRFKSVKDTWSILLLATCIIGGIYSGLFTPTEAAGAGAFFALLIGLRKGRQGAKGIFSSLGETARTTSMIFLLIVGSTFFSFYLSMSGVTQWVSQTVLSLSVPNWAILLLCLSIYLPLGMIIDSISLLLITLPLIFPIIQSLGYNGIWFGVLIVKLNEIAMVTPPLGINLYVIKGVSPPEVKLEDVMIGMLPFLACEMIVLAILVAFPQISLILPSFMR